MWIKTPTGDLSLYIENNMMLLKLQNDSRLDQNLIFIVHPYEMILESFLKYLNMSIVSDFTSHLEI